MLVDGCPSPRWFLGVKGGSKVGSTSSGRVSQSVSHVRSLIGLAIHSLGSGSIFSTGDCIFICISSQTCLSKVHTFFFFDKDFMP